MLLLLIWIENWLKFLGLFAKKNDGDVIDNKSAPKEVLKDIEMRIKNNEFGIQEVNILYLFIKFFLENIISFTN